MATDRLTNQLVPLFNPRRDSWNRHFRWVSVRLIGLTTTGRATISLLQLNRRRILAIRNVEKFFGRHPPV